MGLMTFKCGDVIFRQGDPGDCMYDIRAGKVDIYVNCEGKEDKKIAELYDGGFFGEMGVLDDTVRSATAVAASDDTEVLSISKKEFGQYFKQEPVKILDLMQQMTDRLRDTTQEYLEACRTLEECEEAEKTGAEKSEDLKLRIRKYSDRHKAYNS